MMTSSRGVAILGYMDEIRLLIMQGRISSMVYLKDGNWLV